MSERSEPSFKMKVFQAEPAPYVDPDEVHMLVSARMFNCLQKLDTSDQRKVQTVL